MKLRSNTLYLGLLVVFLVLALCLDGDKGTASASPGRRGGGGSRSRGSSGGWFGSSSSSGKSGGWFSGGKKTSNSGGYGGNYKKKGGMKSKLKKAAVIGAVAYGSYQIGKLSSSFGNYHHGGFGHNYGFNDWNRWREVDGFLCRDTNDCNWIDRNLYCQDYELDFTPSNLWFGGDVARIVGECACPHGMVFDNREMRCENSTFGGGIGTILGGILAVMVILGCCACFAFVAIKRMF